MGKGQFGPDSASLDRRVQQAQTERKVVQANLHFPLRYLKIASLSSLQDSSALPTGSTPGWAISRQNCSQRAVFTTISSRAAGLLKFAAWVDKQFGGS